jgi:flagellar biosynthesis protein FlhA
MVRSVRRRCARSGDRLWPDRPGRRAQGRAADEPHHRHPPPAFRELGFVVPMVRVRDNLALGPNQPIASPSRASSWARTNLARRSARARQRRAASAGRRPCKAKDPTFGLDAVWIRPSSAATRSSRATPWSIPRPSSPPTSTISSLQRAEMFGMDEARKLLDALKEARRSWSPASPRSRSAWRRSPRPAGAAGEGVPLKDFRRIAEAMVDARIRYDLRHARRRPFASASAR